MIKSNYEVEILVNGSPVKEYFHKGQHFIEARGGNNFSIKIRNNGYRRILAVPTVDGLSVLNGKKASKKSGGYIINGYSSLTIDGWRVSDSEVNKFFFTNPSNSYAERTGKGGDVGVIGVAVFREKEVPPVYFAASSSKLYNLPATDWGPQGGIMRGSSAFSAQSLCCSSASNSASAGSGVSQDVGAGFGESKTSHVTTVSFDEEECADAVFEIFYNTRKQLENMGIEFHPVQYVAPRAFPNDYCERP